MAFMKKKDGEKKRGGRAQLIVLAVALFAAGGLATYVGTYAVHAATEQNDNSQKSDGDGETNDDHEAATPGDPAD